ncbi:MAG: dihydroorotase [Flavobacterium sp. MedPE-SWcel]|uniref:dihydroorotase n=1 Tax=uncultured Flavobacterium sp. TaxID=165435 RepID=UPI0009172B19|nr:dihydroorotase [uncultured Flavobacterium sp.]OIQ18691.1 MAG: dihydroorotase [Flavobacterium sp. MedPE-SWcel]
MNLIFKNATIIDKLSPFNNKVVDIKVEAGIIKQIGENITNDSNFEIVELDNLHISRGWFDSSVSFGEPGYEDRETITNGLNTAALSGFTNVALQPSGNPVADKQADIHFLLGKALNATTNVHPIGALTKGSEGKDIAELFDMKNAGAVAFGDYNKAITDANIMKIALQYVQDFDGLVIAYAQDDKIKGKGVVHEGAVSTRLGLKGIPMLAEELQIARNLFLLEYTGGKMHIPTISTAKSVQIIREAKAKGLNVTCSVTVHNLLLTDEVLEEFDTRYRVTPPLRSETERKALIEGVLDGTIDSITSDHNPIDIENKKMEFDLAKNGTIGLESAFGALCTVLPLDVVIEKLTSSKELFQVENHSITKGNKASFTLFNPKNSYTFTEKNILSKSKNSAFLGLKLQGKSYGVYNNEKLTLQQ